MYIISSCFNFGMSCLYAIESSRYIKSLLITQMIISNKLVEIEKRLDALEKLH